MAFRRPKSWLLAASPRRRSRQPFRTAAYPRDERSDTARAPANAAQPPAAPQAPWWRAVLDALAAAPAQLPGRAQARPVDDAALRVRHARTAVPEAPINGADAESVRPLTERLDRQREQLAGIDDHLRRLVELAEATRDGTAVYAPPA